MVGVFHNRALVDRLADFRIELTGGVVWHDAVAPSPADLTLLNQ